MNKSADIENAHGQRAALLTHEETQVELLRSMVLEQQQTNACLVTALGLLKDLIKEVRGLDNNI